MKEQIKQLLKHPLTSIKHPGSVLYPNSWCNSAFVNYLRSCGAEIGENTRFISPTSCRIDVNRADYITIGNNCCLSEVNILAHDYSWYTMLESKNDILPDGGGEVFVGNNCFIGFQALLLKNTHIGDNVIIGARSVVKGEIPSNTVWAGCPAKMICTLEEFYQKRNKIRLKEAFYRRDFIRKKKNRDPNINEMGLFSLLFLTRNEKNYKDYIQNIEFNGIANHKELKDYFYNSIPMFQSFEDFLKASE